MYDWYFFILAEYISHKKWMSNYWTIMTRFLRKLVLIKSSLMTQEINLISNTLKELHGHKNLKMENF